MESVVQLITVLIIFALVLATTYWTTKWIGGIQKNNMKGTNIELIECMRIGQNQFIEIARIGNKYLLLGVSKDTITMLCEVSGDDLKIDIENSELQNNVESFQKLLEKAKKTFSRK